MTELERAQEKYQAILDYLLGFHPEEPVSSVIESLRERIQ